MALLPHHRNGEVASDHQITQVIEPNPHPVYILETKKERGVCGHHLEDHGSEGRWHGSSAKRYNRGSLAKLDLRFACSGGVQLQIEPWVLPTQGVELGFSGC